MAKQTKNVTITKDDLKETIGNMSPNELFEKMESIFKDISEHAEAIEKIMKDNVVYLGYTETSLVFHLKSLGDTKICCMFGQNKLISDNIRSIVSMYRNEKKNDRITEKAKDTGSES